MSAPFNPHRDVPTNLQKTCPGLEDSRTLNSIGLNRNILISKKNVLRDSRRFHFQIPYSTLTEIYAVFFRGFDLTVPTKNHPSPTPLGSQTRWPLFRLVFTKLKLKLGLGRLMLKTGKHQKEWKWWLILLLMNWMLSMLSSYSCWLLHQYCQSDDFTLQFDGADTRWFMSRRIQIRNFMHLYCTYHLAASSSVFLWFCTFILQLLPSLKLTASLPLKIHGWKMMHLLLGAKGLFFRDLCSLSGSAKCPNSAPTNHTKSPYKCFQVKFPKKFPGENLRGPRLGGEDSSQVSALPCLKYVAYLLVYVWPSDV